MSPCYWEEWVAGHSETEKEALKRNKVVGHSGIESGIEDINSDSSDIKFPIKE